jgi:hypothetical protein
MPSGRMLAAQRTGFILAVWSARKPKDLKIGTSGR